MTMITAIAHAARASASDDAPVPWWSVGKIAIAAAALVQVARGAIDLHATLPGAGATLAQLLSHRAGIGEYGALPAYRRAVADRERPWPAAEMLGRVEAAFPRRPAGMAFGYANPGYALVAAHLAGSDPDRLAGALAALVFRPLGLARVRLACAPSNLAATAWGNPGGYDPGWVYHGLLVGPAGEAALLLDRVLDGALFSPALLAASWAVPGCWPDRPWRDAAYGFGLMRGEGEPPGRYVGHSGAGPGSVAALYRREAGGPVGAVFAPGAEPALAAVERRAMALACGAP